MIFEWRKLNLLGNTSSILFGYNVFINSDGVICCLLLENMIVAQDSKENWIPASRTIVIIGQGYYLVSCFHSIAQPTYFRSFFC